MSTEPHSYYRDTDSIIFILSIPSTNEGCWKESLRVQKSDPVKNHASEKQDHFRF